MPIGDDLVICVANADVVKPGNHVHDDVRTRRQTRNRLEIERRFGLVGGDGVCICTIHALEGDRSARRRNAERRKVGI